MLGVGKEKKKKRLSENEPKDPVCSLIRLFFGLFISHLLFFVCYC